MQKRLAKDSETVQPGVLLWVAVKEFTFIYNNKEPLSSAIYPLILLICFKIRNSNQVLDFSWQLRQTQFSLSPRYQ